MCKSTTRQMEAVVVTTDGEDEGLFCSRVYAHELINKERAGVLVGTGIGGLTIREADMMIAGGTEAAIIPIGLGGFVACRALSQRNDDPQTASRPWDKDRWFCHG
ncbi:putative beta-ketoacyl-[acyl-carrier-protein] synthase I [Helianthus annuus]|nr:putative beta-ketoacyl-[acyl-carrier-protein] synthase I [Helianthus annuus]